MTVDFVLLSVDSAHSCEEERVELTVLVMLVLVEQMELVEQLGDGPSAAGDGCVLGVMGLH